METWSEDLQVQGLITCIIGLATYFWMIDFPENCQNSLYFLTKAEQEVAVRRIHKDRGDVTADKFDFGKVLVHALDPKVYGFTAMFFLLNLVSTSLSYFLPIIPTEWARLQRGSINPPLCPSVLLRGDCSSHILNRWGQIPYSGTGDCLQLALPDHWILHAWVQ